MVHEEGPFLQLIYRILMALAIHYAWVTTYVGNYHQHSALWYQITQSIGTIVCGRGYTCIVYTVSHACESKYAVR